MKDIWKADPPAGAERAWVGKSDGSALGVHEKWAFASFKAAGGVFGPAVPSPEELVAIEKVVAAARDHVKAPSGMTLELLWVALQQLEHAAVREPQE